VPILTVDIRIPPTQTMHMEIPRILTLLIAMLPISILLI